MKDNWSEKVWLELNNLLSLNNEELALVYLYETLIDELGNIDNCDSFLKKSVGMQMNSDVIVHILNALSPIKAKLRNWDDFKIHSTKLLEDEVGVQLSKTLLNAIIT